MGTPICMLILGLTEFKSLTLEIFSAVVNHAVNHSFVFVGQCHLVSRTVMVLSEEQEKVKASYFTLYAAS